MTATTELSRNFKLALVAAAVLSLAGLSDAQAQQEFVTADRFVPHVSTVPANAGQRIGLFVHEKLTASLAADIEAGSTPEGRVPLNHQ